MKKDEKPEKQEYPSVTPVAKSAAKLKVVQQVNGVQQDVTPEDKQESQDQPGGDQKATGGETGSGKKNSGGKP